MRVNGSRPGLIWNAIVGEDRTQLAVHARGHRRLFRGVAWVTIASFFLLGWGAGTVTAISILFGQEYHPTVLEDARAIGAIAVKVAIAGGAWFTIVSLRAASGSHVSTPPIRTQLRAFPVAMFAMASGFMIQGAINKIFGLTSNDYPYPDYDTLSSRLLGLADSMMAGPTEELALMALVITALRTAGYSWWVVCVTAVAVRVPFHLYYGWGALGLTVWALLIIVLYRRTNALLAIVLAHAAFNGLNYLDDLGVAIKWLLIFSGLAIVWWEFHKLLPTGKRAP
jgi:hypothetical protein